MIAHKFLVPWAGSGDKTAIPTTTPSDGSVSYPTGWGFDYSRDPTTDPLAKQVDRGITNQLGYDLTSAVGQLQKQGFPEWITAAENGGSAFSYDVNAVVRYSDGINYMSLVAANTATPGTDATKWAPLGATPTIWTASDTGAAANTYAATLPLPFSAYAANQVVVLYVAHTNTGAATFTATPAGGAALASKSIKKMSAGSLAALAAGDLVAGSFAILSYDGTQFVLTGGTSLALADNSLKFASGGGLQVNETITSYSTNQTLTAAAHHLANIVATAALTLTLPKSSTAGMMAFEVLAQGGAVTLAPNAADAIQGGSTGASLVLPQGSSGFLVTDGASNWWFFGSRVATTAQVQAGTDFSAPITPAALAGAMGASVAASGYQKFPDGLIIQWGQTAVSASDVVTDVSLPITFPNAFLRAYASIESYTVNTGIRVCPTKQSTSVIRLQQNATATTSCSWMAIGN